MLTAHACRAAKGEEITPSASPTETALPTAVWTAPPSSTPPPPTLTPTAEFLFTVTPQPALTPTPFPDAQQIADLVAEGKGSDSAGHWAAHLSPGSFTAPAADERAALVGNIGAEKEVRWVIVAARQLLGSSEWLAAGFDAPPSFYLPPELLDFDGDGRQELLSHYFRAQRGVAIAADTLYRWDGLRLANVWSLKTLQDNTGADGRDVTQPYRESSRVEWAWSDVDADGLSDDIRALESVTFYSPGGETWGEETWQHAFCWNGIAFRPCRPGGPARTFAYTDLGALWIWQDGAAYPLNADRVREFQWSPDGGRIAWWSGASAQGEPDAGLGVYDFNTNVQTSLALGGGEEIAALRWTADGQIIYSLADRSTFLLDPVTGKRTFLSVAPVGDWAPDGVRVAYEREGGLYISSVLQQQERALISAPAGEGAPVLLAGPAWSPTGEWIACLWSDGRVMALSRVSAAIVDAVSSAALLGNGAVDIVEQPLTARIVWSPDSDSIALLVTYPGPSTSLYLADLPADPEPLAQTLEIRPALSLTTTHLLGPAWSPDGRRVVLAAGGDVWEVTPEGEMKLRYHFPAPQVEWNVLEWSPDGVGFLAGLERTYARYLYWFPANGDPPSLLLSGVIADVKWSPYSNMVLEMVFVEHKDETPVIHFVAENGSDVAVVAKGADRSTLFQVGGRRVYYNKFYADRRGAGSLYASGTLAGCHSPVASRSGERLAWLCDDGLPDWSAIISGTAQIHFRLMVTDENGRNAQEVWNYVESGPDYRNFSLMGWREDETAVFLSRPKYGTAWAYFDYNPGILSLDVATGEMKQIGDLEGIHDARVSADEAWLVQSRVEEWPREGVTILLRSLPDGAQREIAAAEGTTVAGDFSFSPNNVWLAWREWVNAPGGSTLLIRALRLPDGEPLTICGDSDATAPRIGGWLGENDLVLVYPVLDDGSGGYSTHIALPGVGVGEPLSPYTFLGARTVR